MSSNPPFHELNEECPFCKKGVMKRIGWTYVYIDGHLWHVPYWECSECKEQTWTYFGTVEDMDKGYDTESEDEDEGYDYPDEEGIE